MRRRFGPIFLLAALAATMCHKQDASTPRGALAAMAPCVEDKDPSCLYRKLDRDSRWSLQTIHKTLGRIKALAEESYPPEKRDAALGSWAEEAEAKDPATLFGIYCDERGWMRDLPPRFGPAREISISDGSNRARITTIRGGSIELLAHDGKWGLSDFGEQLAADKIRLLDRLERVEKNAAAFEEQRLAESSPRGDQAEIENPRPPQGESP